VLDGLILFAVILSLAYLRVSVLLWTFVLFAVLIIFTAFSRFSNASLIFFWIIFLLAAGFANLGFLRKRFFSRPLAMLLKDHMPSISPTERDAIVAGDVWWEKELFCGQPQWKKLLALPKPELSSEEQDFIDHQVETLCGMLDDWQIIKNHDLPKNVWDYLKKERFLGMILPKEYGGRGFSALAHSTIVVKIATRSISAAVNAMVPNSLGPGELLLHYGTTEQKQYYLPRLARGEEIPCFALTGPEAGSDASAMTDSGVVCYGMHEGKKVLGIRLSWDKRYITLAPVATVLGVAFRLYDPEHLLGKENEIGITLCLIPTTHPGVEIGHRHLPLHMAFMNGPTRGKDVFIPIDWIIGGVEKAGQGWRMLMECLSVGRAISLPALSTACGVLAYFATGSYARIRRQFNLPIARFEGVEESLSVIAGYAYLLEASRLMTASAVDQKVRPVVVSAIAKYHMTEMARTVIAHAMDIHAGQAIQAGPRNLLAHAHMAIPVSITVEGANILTRNLIIFGQGAILCHPYVLHEVECLSKKNINIHQFDSLLLSHMGYFIHNVVRNACLGLTAGKFLISPVRGPLARYYRQLTRMSAALAFVSDISMMLLRGQLKRKERISARLGDMLSQLYLASTVLKYFNDQGQPAEELNYVRWCLKTCLYEIEIACNELFNNFPSRAIGKLLRWIIFPWGFAYKKPTDGLCHKITKLMISPSALRDRLMRFCYISKKENEPTARLQKAFLMIDAVEPVWKKIQSATKHGTLPSHLNFEERLKLATQINMITHEEEKLLKEFELLYREIIKVDEFSFDLSTVI